MLIKGGSLLRIQGCSDLVRRTMASLVERTVVLSSSSAGQDDQPIHYVESVGSESKAPPVLLFPGVLGTARSDFTPTLEGLKDKFHLIGMDPPGFGKSRPPARTWPEDDVYPTYYHRDAQVADRFMSQALGHQKYSVIGWSDGGISSLIMAAIAPERVDRVVCLAGQAYFTQKEMDGMLALKDVSKWSERMRKPMEDTYGEDFPKLWAEFCDACESLMKNRGGDVSTELLTKINCPILIVHGQKDPIVAAEHPDHLKANLKNARVELFPDGKHNLHFKYAKEFNQLVEDFLISS